MKGKDGGVDSQNESCSDDTAAGNKILTSDWNISAEAGRHSDIVEGAKNETIMLKKLDLKLVTSFKKQSEDMAENSALRGMAQAEGCMDDQSIMSKAIDFTIGHDNIPPNEANEHLIMFSKPDYGSQNKHAWMATEQSPEISLSKKEVPNKKARKATKAGSLEGEFEARLAALNEVNQLSTLTVVDLRKILRKIGMPIASRKQDLVLEVKKFLTTRKTLGLLQEQSASDDQVKDIKSFTKSQELKQAQVLEMDCGRLGMDCITNSVCQFPLVSSPEQKEDQELQRGIRRISRKKNSVICSSETPAPEQISISVPEQEQTQIIQVITENMGRAEEIVSPYPELPHQLCQLVSNTVVETHESTSDLPDGASLFEKEQKQVRFEFLTGNVVKADIGAYDYTGQVYKRRWHRNMMAQTKTERLVEKDNSHNGKEVHHTLEVCSKVSDVRCKDKVLPARKTDAKVHDQFQSVPMTTSKKRKMVKGPHTSEPEVLTVVSQEVLTVVSQESELTMNINEPWTMLVHKKIQPGWIAYNPLTMRPSPPTSGIGVMKLLSWNVNGLRALLKEKSEQRKNPILDLSERENFDVLCLQETKLQEKDVEKIKTSLPPDYEYSFWSCSLSKLGYSGTAVISRIKPLSVRYGLGIIHHDSEGRLITLEFDGFYLVAGYVPNSGQKLERLAYRTQEWDPVLSDYMKKLEKNKPVVLTGDLNCAHQEIDIFNPDGNRRSAGFTTEERISFEVNFLNKGLVDSFRRQNQDVVAYTYWGYRTGARATNRGWRLDYFLISQAIADHVHDSYTLPHVGGSDHCPIGLILRV